MADLRYIGQHIDHGVMARFGYKLLRIASLTLDHRHCWSNRLQRLLQRWHALASKLCREPLTRVEALNLG